MILFMNSFGKSGYKYLMMKCNVVNNLLDYIWKVRTVLYIRNGIFSRFKCSYGVYYHLQKQWSWLCYDRMCKAQLPIFSLSESFPVRTTVCHHGWRRRSKLQVDSESLQFIINARTRTDAFIITRWFKQEFNRYSAFSWRLNKLCKIHFTNIWTKFIKYRLRADFLRLETVGTHIFNNYLLFVIFIFIIHKNIYNYL